MKWLDILVRALVSETALLLVVLLVVASQLLALAERHPEVLLALLKSFGL